MPRSGARRLADSGEREAGRSFGQGQVDGFKAAGGRIRQAGRQGVRRSRNGRRAGHGGADAAGGAGAAALLVMARGRMVRGLGDLRAGVVTMVRAGHCVLHGCRGRSDAMLHGRVRAREHACRGNALEGNCQQQQPHESTAQADMDDSIHGAILAWRRHNTVATLAAARLAGPGIG